MTALAGIWSFGGGEGLREKASSILTAQADFAPDDPSLSCLGNVVMGRGLFRLLPEDHFDVQPLVSSAGDFMLVADARLDNRDELTDSLGRTRGAELSDAQLLFLAYQRWGEGVLNRAIGDFAFAAWREAEKLLTLARDPMGQRPLHYHLGDGFVAFASMPQGLHALPQIPRELDREQLAGFVADLRGASSSTYFKRIKRVEPGQVLNISPAAVEARYYWQPSPKEIRFRRDEEYIEAFREQLDRATRVRLRGAGPVVGAHLSAGLDSSAVASTAARLIAAEGGKVLAFTSAPREGFSGPLPKTRIADESAIAASVAQQYDNMEHIIIRSGRYSPLDLLEAGPRLYQEPVGYPCNYVWWSAINDEARARGVSVMLTGEVGNLTISAGGVGVLADFVRTGQWLRWWWESKALRKSVPTWRGLLATSFGPWFPRWLWGGLASVSSAERTTGGAALLHPQFRAEMEQRLRAEGDGDQPEKNEKAFRLRLLKRVDSGNSRKGALARWGIDGRDPTADRRLIEFCFSLPPDQLLKGGVTRRMARVGLADRLPDAVLKAPRGYQYADWYEALDATSFDTLFSELERSEDAAAVLDMEAVRHLASSWPGEDVASLATIGTYRMALLMAVSAGVFAAAARK
jgi:asparagine synthase (glutamine-hydrolysing)